MDDVAVQASIINDLRAYIGGPGSLRWPSHELLPALASATGRMCALTLRKADEVADQIANSAALLTEQMRELYAQREPAPLPLVDLDSVDTLRDELLMVTARPTPVKKPSHLVVGALVSVLGQLAALRGCPLTEVAALVERARAQTPPSLVRKFQHAANWQRSMRGRSS